MQQTNPIPPQNIDSPIPETIIQPKQKNNLPIVLAIGVVVLIIIIAGVAIFILPKKNNYKPVTQSTYPPAVHTNPTPPQATPVTSANVDATLDGTDASMQQSLDQANTDLNQINNINTTQDTDTGL